MAERSTSWSRSPHTFQWKMPWGEPILTFDQFHDYFVAISFHSIAFVFGTAWSSALGVVVLRDRCHPVDRLECSWNCSKWSSNCQNIRWPTIGGSCGAVGPCGNSRGAKPTTSGNLSGVRDRFPISQYFPRFGEAQIQCYLHLRFLALNLIAKQHFVISLMLILHDILL